MAEPPPVVTVTGAAPAAPAGLVTTIDVAESVVIVADAEPNLTDVALPRFVPVIVTVVPPSVVPLVGLTVETVGAPIGWYVNCCGAVVEP